MSARLGVPAFAPFRSPTMRLTSRFRLVSSLALAITRGRRPRRSTAIDATMASQKGLSFILFMAISLFVLRGFDFARGLRGRHGRFTRLFAHRHLQRDPVAPVVLRPV